MTAHKSPIWVLGFVAIVGFATTCFAQEQGQRRNEQQSIQQQVGAPYADQQGQTAQRHEMNKPVLPNAINATNTADAQLAGCLIVDNQGEIALGKLAQQKAKDKEVKQFADKMVQDHTQFLEQLEKFASASQRMNGANSSGAAVVPEHGTQSAATEAAVPGSITQPMGGQTLNFVALKQEIGQKCLDMERKDLDQKQGTQFDKCYIGAQIGAHMHVLATLEVFRNQASPELASLLDKGIETTKSHLEHAQKIAKAFEKE